MQVVQLEATAVVASLLPGLLTYYPVDQFAVAPPLPGTPAGAGLVVEAWAPNKLRPGSPPFAAPRWHLPSEAEVRAAVGIRVLTLRLGSPPFAAPQWHLPSEAEVRERAGFAWAADGLGFRPYTQ